MQDVREYSLKIARQARAASRQLAVVNAGRKNEWLRRSALNLSERAGDLLFANEQDLQQAPSYGLTTAAIDRLKLSESRLEAIAAGLRDVAQLPDPVGEVIDSNVRPNGLLVTRVRAPLGVVFFIFESRPNVTADAAALCVKSGNAVILRGGKEALQTNLAIYQILRETLLETGLPEHAVQLVETADRDVVGHLLQQRDLIDVTIPRGGKSLIERVVAEARMPVIKHFDGVCHVYVDSDADLTMAVRILINSKCQRPGVCNAAESLLVHADVAQKFLELAGPQLLEAGVEIRGDEKVRQWIPRAMAATEEDYRTEFLDLKLAAKVVGDLNEAIRHINEYGSHHTDVIVTRDLDSARRFAAEVDSAAVIVNASTRFNDGAEFGLGAEIGISTDKFHARGPCGLKELTTYKYVALGDGQLK